MRIRRQAFRPEKSSADYVIVMRRHPLLVHRNQNDLAIKHSWERATPVALKLASCQGMIATGERVKKSLAAVVDF